ncbi:MAG: alginate O-acetyltransferase AlgX-related protein [Candidatus Binatia bacterium]
MRQVFQKFALVMVSVMVTLALCEGLSWVTPRPLLPARLREVRDRLDLYRRTEGMFVADSELLFKIRPNTDTIASHPDYRVRLRTQLNLDGIGFRGGSLGGPAWGAAVGDSFTFGVGMDQQDTWVALLAKALEKEIINLGIPAQGPAQYTRVLKRYALALHPRVIFYCFYFNDLDAANRFYRMRRTLIPLSRYMRQYSIVYNIIADRRGVAAQEADPLSDDGAELNISPQGIRRTLERQDRNFAQRWKVTVQEIDEAIKASEKANIKLVMLYLPSRWEVYWESVKAQNQLPDSLDIDRLRRTVVEFCGERKIACLDLTPALKFEAQQGKPLYFRTDGHWNKEGNRVVSEALKKFLTEKGLAG